MRIPETRAEDQRPDVVRLWAQDFALYNLTWRLQDDPIRSRLELLLVSQTGFELAGRFIGIHMDCRGLSEDRGISPCGYHGLPYIVACK
jgi:hypothetical protein